MAAKKKAKKANAGRKKDSKPIQDDNRVAKRYQKKDNTTARVKNGAPGVESQVQFQVASTRERKSCGKCGSPDHLHHSCPVLLREQSKAVEEEAKAAWNTLAMAKHRKKFPNSNVLPSPTPTDIAHRDLFIQYFIAGDKGRYPTIDENLSLLSNNLGSLKEEFHSRETNLESLKSCYDSRFKELKDLMLEMNKKMNKRKKEDKKKKNT